MLPAFLKRLKRHIPLMPYWRHVHDLNVQRGMVVSMWAGIESAIDQANHAGFVITNQEISNIVPQNFKRKVELFHKLHREVELFVPFDSVARSLTSRLRGMLETRHFFVHGYFVPDKSEVDREGWILRRHAFRKDGGLDTIERRFIREEIYQVRDDLLKMQNEIADYLNILSEIIDLRKSEGTV